MRKEALAFWSRAREALDIAEELIGRSPDTAASRAYYAAFYAVTALFSLEDKSFSKHSSLRAAVHRDLVHTGKWSEELGEAYSSLMQMRMIGDYGGLKHISENNARDAIEAAKRILAAVHQAHPEPFPLTKENKI